MQQCKPLFDASGYQFCSSHIDLGQIQALTDFIDVESEAVAAKSA